MKYKKLIKNGEIMKKQIQKINLLTQNAYENLEQNNLDEVAKIINELEKFDNIYSKIRLSCLYIDYGSAIKEKSLIIKGIELIQLNQSTMINFTPQYLLLYNLANGYMNYYSLTKNKFLNGKNIIIEIKNLFKKAFKISDNADLSVQILVNLGNFYNYFGRYADALEYYEEALRINPTHGMALVNKGQSLIQYRNFMNHDSPMLLDAYNCFKDALKSNNLTYQGKMAAEMSIKIFEENNNPLSLNKKNKTKLNIKPYYSNLEELSNIFCYNNRLYLNLCNFCQKCENAIGDTIAIKRMTTPFKNEKIEDDLFLVLSSYLNQIKMDFISARLNLILYQYEELDLKFINDNVVIIDSLNYEMHNIRIQLVKDSFKSFYDILDKISFFINEYFDLGIEPWQIDFKKFWYDDFKKKILREELDLNNNGLKALFDIHGDILYGDEKKLNKIRNTLTHRVLKIKLFSVDEEKDTLTEEELFNRTVDLAKIVRNAIIYLMVMVDIEESKKDDSDSVPMFAHEVPNYLK